jgi:hypothetical protein
MYAAAEFVMMGQQQKFVELIISNSLLGRAMAN